MKPCEYMGDALKRAINQIKNGKIQPLPPVPKERARVLVGEAKRVADSCEIAHAMK